MSKNKKLIPIQNWESLKKAYDSEDGEIKKYPKFFSDNTEIQEFDQTLFKKLYDGEKPEVIIICGQSSNNCNSTLSNSSDISDLRTECTSSNC
jgi:hypothetical protein